MRSEIFSHKVSHRVLAVIFATVFFTCAVPSMARAQENDGQEQVSAGETQEESTSYSSEETGEATAGTGVEDTGETEECADEEEESAGEDGAASETNAEQTQGETSSDQNVDADDPPESSAADTEEDAAYITDESTAAEILTEGFITLSTGIGVGDATVGIYVTADFADDDALDIEVLDASAYEAEFDDDEIRQAFRIRVKGEEFDQAVSVCFSVLAPEESLSFLSLYAVSESGIRELAGGYSEESESDIPYIRYEYCGEGLDTAFVFVSPGASGDGDTGEETEEEEASLEDTDGGQEEMPAEEESTEDSTYIDNGETATILSGTDSLAVAVTGTKEALNGAVSVHVVRYGSEDVAVFEELVNQVHLQALHEPWSYSLVNAWDITLYDASGEETEPAGQVSVALSGSDIAKLGDDAEIHHLIEEKPIGEDPQELDIEETAGLVEIERIGSVDEISGASDELSFTTESFSTYYSSTITGWGAKIYQSTYFSSTYGGGYIKITNGTPSSTASSNSAKACSSLESDGILADDMTTGDYCFVLNTGRSTSVYIDHTKSAVCDGVYYDIREYVWQTGDIYPAIRYSDGQLTGVTHTSASTSDPQTVAREFHFYTAGHVGESDYEVSFYGVLHFYDLDLTDSGCIEKVRVYQNVNAYYFTNPTYLNGSAGSTGTVYSTEGATDSDINGVWYEVSGTSSSPLKFSQSTGGGLNQGVNYTGVDVYYKILTASSLSKASTELPAGYTSSYTRGSARYANYKLVSYTSLYDADVNTSGRDADYYTFSGWYTNSSCTTSAGTTAAIATSDTTYYGYFTRAAYDITTSAVNGTIDESVYGIANGDSIDINYNTSDADFTLSSVTLLRRTDDGGEYEICITESASGAVVTVNGVETDLSEAETYGVSLSDYATSVEIEDIDADWDITVVYENLSELLVSGKSASQNDDGTYEVGISGYLTQEIVYDLGEETAVVDYVTDEFTVEAVAVYMVPYLTGGAWGDESTWIEITEDVTVSLAAVTDETSDMYGMTEVVVSGYDYSAYYISETDKSADGSGDYGYRLEIILTLSASGTFGGNGIPTNGDASGIYLIYGGTAIHYFDIPEVDIPINYGVVISEDKESYINPNDLTDLVTLQSGYEPDGLNNEFVDITYMITDESGAVVASAVVYSGESASEIEWVWGEGYEDATDEQSDIYTISVLVTPVTEGTVTAVNITENETVTGTVYYPYITFDDTEITYGEAVDFTEGSSLSADTLGDHLSALEWKDVNGGKGSRSDAPELTYSVYSEKGVTDGVIATTADIPVDVDVYMDDVKVTGVAFFSHICTVYEDDCAYDASDGAAFLVHVMTPSSTGSGGSSASSSSDTGDTTVYNINHVSVSEDNTEGGEAAVNDNNAKSTDGVKTGDNARPFLAAGLAVGFLLLGVWGIVVRRRRRTGRRR